MFCFLTTTTTLYYNHFTALFPEPPGWDDTRRELLDFIVQGKINRGRHTDHPAGRHSFGTNQCSPPPSPPHFLQAGCHSCSPTNSVEAKFLNRSKNKAHREHMAIKLQNIMTLPKFFFQNCSIFNGAIRRCQTRASAQYYVITRKPSKGAAVIAASMHDFANCRKFKSPITLTLDRLKVILTYTVRVGLPACPTV